MSRRGEWGDLVGGGEEGAALVALDAQLQEAALPQAARFDQYIRI